MGPALSCFDVDLSAASRPGVTPKSTADAKRMAQQHATAQEARSMIGEASVHPQRAHQTKCTLPPRAAIGACLTWTACEEHVPKGCQACADGMSACGLLQASLPSRPSCWTHSSLGRRAWWSQPGPAASASCRRCTCAAHTCRLPGSPSALSGMWDWCACLLPAHLLTTELSLRVELPQS